MKHCTQCNFSLQKPVMILKICLYFLLAANIVQWKDNETPKKKKKKKNPTTTTTTTTKKLWSNSFNA